jgi:2-polyprenyl-3-methyl-5-hydroxy-6-metoxy-1,4-benzoquinol methylase
MGPNGCAAAGCILQFFPTADETMKVPDQHEYVLRGGEQGAERLRLLASVKWPTTKTLLERAGLRQGRDCLDVGCGIGAVSLQMAEIVGPPGRVVGMDMDERCLELARLEAQRLGLNVEFRIGSATDL